MKRRGFLTGTISGGLAGIAAAAGEEPKTELPLMATPAVLMAPRHDGVEVVWAVNQLCRGWVEWKDAQGGSGRVAADAFGFVPQSDDIFKVRLAGLKAGENYQVRAIVAAGDGSGKTQESGWKKFRTLNPESTETRFVVWNDTHQHDDTIAALHKITPPADFLLWNGDLCNNWIKESELVPTLLNPAGQDASEGRPILWTWGNHDVRGEWAFKMPDHVATPGGRPFYAFRSGPVAVICLHTGEDKPDAHPSFGGRVAFEPLRREQAEWLKEIILRPEFKNAPHKVLFCHIPLRWLEEPDNVDYDVKGFDHYARSSRDAWHDSLVAWGVQVVISGHTHKNAYLPANEKFPYAQMVSGGPKMEAARWIEGTADSSGLKLVMRDLAGNISQEAVFARL